LAENCTLLRFIESHANERGQDTALKEMRPDGSWRSLSWSDYWKGVREIAKGLIALGHQPGDIVAQVGNNRIDWVLCQFGVSAAGGVIAPIYTTNTAEQTAYIVRHCAAKIAICDNEAQLEKYLQCVRDELMDVETIIIMDGVKPNGGESDRKGGPYRAGEHTVDVLSLDELRTRGRDLDDDQLDARVASLEPESLALLIFTSGTTGLPKGAEYTHAGIDAIASSVADLYPELFAGETRYISYLPLCHVAEQAFTNFVGLRVGGTVAFCADMTKLKDVLTAVRPTLFFAVPRVWEKFEAALRSKLGAATGIKATLANWALRTELAAFERSVSTGKEVNTFARRFANKLVISKIQLALGLDALMGAGSGAAPIGRSTLNFFASIGIPILEGYGMTETTGFATSNPMGLPRFGTVGKPVPGVEVKVADDGEIMLKGPNMIRGYLKLPELSAELYTDGWMHTGDLGEVDSDGFLTITGRKKDLIITAGGKNVAPTEIEQHLQALPGVGQAVVVGDRKPYLCALIALEQEALPGLCSAAGVGEAPLAELADNDKVRAYLQDRIESDCNSKLARYQTIKKFEILPNAFSVDGGELTPTLKVKRNVVGEKYADNIEAFYA
jgi:long-chain acyl-CoA synthetase